MYNIYYTQEREREKYRSRYRNIYVRTILKYFKNILNIKCIKK